jgi:hypothetical protein
MHTGRTSAHDDYSSINYCKDQLPDAMLLFTTPDGFITFSARVSPGLKVTVNVGAVKLPSLLIVPVATTIPLRERVTVIAAAVAGHVKLCEPPPPMWLQFPVAPGSNELQRGEPLSRQASDPARTETDTESTVKVLGELSELNVVLARL